MSWKCDSVELSLTSETFVSATGRGAGFAWAAAALELPAKSVADPIAINGASSIYSHTANLHDVTSGSNGSTCPVNYYCHAGAGYDGPTGLGTPNGLGVFSN